MAGFFTEVSEPIRYTGPDSDDLLTFRWHDADRVVGERTMAEHLRTAVCYWHSFDWPGSDVFGNRHSSGNGSWSHQGRSMGSTRLTHLTHQKPRRPGATSRTGEPWPRRSGSPP